MIRTLRSVLQFRRWERDPARRRLAGAASIADLRELARRRLPGGVFDYIDGAAEDEVTNRRNQCSFDAFEFRPRVLRDVSNVDTRTTVLGQERPLPLILSPTGFTRMADPAGELAVARCAARAGLPYTLSTLSTRSIEEVAAVASGPRWFQVYVWKDRGLVRNMLERAHAQGYEAMVLTVDTAVLGRRERDVRRGFSLPPKLGLETLWDGLVHPGWTWRFLRAEPILFANLGERTGRPSSDDRVEVDPEAPRLDRTPRGADPVSLSDFVNAQFDASLSWRDLDWFRTVWPGAIVIKGIQSVEDARIAQTEGVDAIALSNHGGRQLDGAPPPVELIEPVRSALGDDLEVYCDGGIRRGADIVKALALGADACMIGRAYLYGLGAAGEAGVDFVLDHLREGVRRTMALIGVTSVADLSRDSLAEITDRTSRPMD